jgi:hypothetical protein
VQIEAVTFLRSWTPDESDMDLYRTVLEGAVDDSDAKRIIAARADDVTRALDRNRGIHPKI